MEFKIEELILGNGQIQVSASGRLNAITAPDFKEKLKQLAGDGYHTLIIDLKDVSFIDSSGLAALVSGLRAAREAGGTLFLTGLNEQTISAFRLSRLDQLFTIYPNVEDAVDNLAAS